jgi:inner membrane transporter RhtA
MIVSLVTFQIGIALSKGAFDQIGAPAVSFLRQGFGAAILFTMFRPRLRGLAGRQWGAVVGMGGSTALMTLLYFLALDRIPIGIATALTFSAPALMALGGARSRGYALWVTISISGVVLLAPWGGGGMNLVGSAIAGLAGLSYAAFIVIANRGGASLPRHSALPLSVACSAVLLAPVGVATGGSGLVDASVVATVALTSLLSTVIPNVLEFSVIRRIPASLHGVLVSLNPAVGSVAGVVMLSESIGPIGVLAIAFICAGVVMAHRAAKLPMARRPQCSMAGACA